MDDMKDEGVVSSIFKSRRRSALARFGHVTSADGIRQPRHHLLIFLVMSAALIGVGLGGGAIFLRQLRTQLFFEQAESARRNAEAMAHILERDLKSGQPAEEVIDRLQTATQGMAAETEFLCLFDENGVLLSHPNQEMVGRSKGALQMKRIATGAPLGTVETVLRRRQPTSGLLQESPDSSAQIVHFQPVNGTPWTLAAHENADLVAAQVTHVGWQLAAILVPTVALMGIIGTGLAQAMNRRYERQIEIANVELEQRVMDRTKELTDALNELRSAHEQLVQGEKMHLLGELMAGIAHEINNPLCVVSGYATLLAQGDFGPVVRRYGAQLEASVQRILRIVANLLAFARHAPPTRRLASLVDLIRRALELIASNLRDAQVQVEADFPADIEALCFDEQQLEQVFLNLFNNSRHALERHDGERKIFVRVREDIAGDVIIEVSDTGPGLAPKVRANLFRPFTTTKSDGTGLGLSLCRRFVEAHGGTIEALSVDRGAAFEIRLPRAVMAGACILPPV
jgi:C4-dicarboxylate-specific signal transduction histidine kinase